MSETTQSKGIFVPTQAQCAQSLSLRLLAHRGLMTPRLTAAFGAMTADKVSITERDQRLTRKSRLISVESGEIILRAELSIVFENLPEMLVSQLRGTFTLFGQLLLDHKIDVSVAEPQIFQTPDGRYGRRTKITGTSGGIPICDVAEIMSYDPLLSVIAQRHQDQGRS
ncbi:hypothetical protein DS901_12130 [Loktanella sp. D2R18]|uniref:hypothetical protein n=1 Tax=Rhodobacterales TaxID=204455 RepID=UPI000DE9DC43|nr:MULTISPECIES: hypothetical protein [Rhodobacterales]MDO6590205.1 hypothetical protein [Yoonia sp. 1_MG-2023]RBW42971.1 hypothetical protein DS901_12130 [Loktanella sp. D2R18]